MRTAIVNWTNRRVGGAEAYLARIMPALLDEGHELFFWHEQSGPADRDVIGGLNRMTVAAGDGNGIAASLRTLEQWKPDVLYVHGLVSPDCESSVLKVAPAVLFAHNYYGTCITGAKTTSFPTVQPCSRRFGPKCLAHFYPNRCGGLNPVKALIEYRRQAARFDNLHHYREIVTFSDHMQREYVNHGFKTAHVHRLPPVDPMAAGTAPPLLAAGAPGANVHRLTFIGRADRLKGLHMLLSALPDVRARLRERIQLSIAGDGPDLQHCRKAAQQLSAAGDGIVVTFLGWLPPTGVENLLGQTDALVVPSLWPEPFGLVGIEAMRRGVPVAAFNVGAIGEWLEDGKTGALAPADPPTPAGLAAAIARVLTTRAIRDTVRDRARRGLPDCSISTHVRALARVLQTAAACPTAHATLS